MKRILIYAPGFTAIAVTSGSEFNGIPAGESLGDNSGGLCQHML